MSSSFLVSVSQLGLFPPRGGVLGLLFMLLGLIFLNLDLIGSEDAGLWDPQVHALTPELWGTKPLSRHPWNSRSCRHFPAYLLALSSQTTRGQPGRNGVSWLSGQQCGRWSGGDARGFYSFLGDWGSFCSVKLNVQRRKAAFVGIVPNLRVSKSGDRLMNRKLRG